MFEPQYIEIEKKIDYSNGTVNFITYDLPLVHMTEYHEDGSESHYYFLELTKEQFDEIRESTEDGD